MTMHMLVILAIKMSLVSIAVLGVLVYIASISFKPKSTGMPADWKHELPAKAQYKIISADIADRNKVGLVYVGDLEDAA